MMPNTFSILDDSRAILGERIVDCQTHDPAVLEQYRYTIEGTSKSHTRHPQKLFVHDFRSIAWKDLPNGISINIQDPLSTFASVRSAEFTKVSDISEVTICVGFDYADWHLPQNLQHFAKLYCSKLTTDSRQTVNVESNLSEYGVAIFASSRALPTDSLLQSFQKLEPMLLDCFRSCISEATGVQPLEAIPVSSPTADEPSGAKWWFKNVIVPLSGAIAALIAGVLALFK